MVVWSGLTTATPEEQYLVSALCWSQLPSEKELVALDPANKPPLVAVVFLFASSRLRAEKKDLKKILWSFLRGLTLSGTKTHVKGFWSCLRRSLYNNLNYTKLFYWTYIVLYLSDYLDDGAGKQVHR